MASVRSFSPPSSPTRYERSLSPTASNGVPSCNYVVVWEWETRPHRWRPYCPEVTQLLERAHNKKINKIYLKDADPLLCEYFIDMTNFEQVCEPTGETYSVRREYYAHTSPAAKGSKWEWASITLSGSNGSNSNEWHIYDMEVQTVIEESWATGEQTIDIGQHFPGCPYIINFCNLTQVRRTTGIVRPIRRQPCAAYPMVKLTPAEIASMLHRKEERRMDFAAEVERRIKDLKSKKHKRVTKKAVKHLMNHLFHPVNLKDFGKKHSAVNGLNPPPSSPIKATQPQQPNFSSAASTAGSGYLLPSRRVIGHPSAISEASFPTVVGRRQHHYAPTSTTSSANSNPINYKRFHDYASFSSFSDTSSCIVRRPSVDTISTYMSHDSMYRRQHHGSSNGYRYGGSSTRGSSYYGGSFGSQDLIDMYGHETDSVFTDEEADRNSISYHSNRSRSGYEEASWPQPLKQRVLSDPAIHHHVSQDLWRHRNQGQGCNTDSDLYVNLQDNLSLRSQHRHSRQSSLAASQNSLLRSPQRGATVHNFTQPQTPPSRQPAPESPSRNGTLRKRPVPTPRTILNTTPPKKNYNTIDKLVMKYSQFVIDPNGPDDFCPVCNRHLDEQSPPKDVDNTDLTSVICLTSCQHKIHMACVKWSTPEMTTCLKCPTCTTISGFLSGDMPTSGASLTYKVIPKGLPGYEDYHAIQITYNMGNGIQDARHPHPGAPYYAIGFPKIAFLPDTELGRLVLRLLEKAFNQHLTFTLVTNRGARDAMVQWNPAIGHKTEFGPAEDRNSYPDPGYLEDVARQLARLGISTETNDEDDEHTV